MLQREKERVALELKEYNNKIYLMKEDSSQYTKDLKKRYEKRIKKTNDKNSKEIMMLTSENESLKLRLNSLEDATRDREELILKLKQKIDNQFKREETLEQLRKETSILEKSIQGKTH